MLPRRRSKGFLLDVVSRGTAFVETLQQTGYPKVGALNGQDFDWMFECVEAEQFLEWFCHGVDEGSLLDTQRREEYEALLEAGYPILEGPALEEVLGTCREPLRLTGLQPLEEEEKKPLETLEEELQQLRTTRNLLLRNRNKLQVRASQLKHKQCRLSAEEELLTRALREVMWTLEEEGMKMDAALMKCRQKVLQLVQHCSCRGEEVDGGTLLPLTSGLALDLFVELEQNHEDDMVQKAKEKLHGLAEVTEIPVREALDGSHTNRKEALWEELNRLRLCHVSGQWERLSLQVELQSTRAGLQWAEREKVLTSMEDPSSQVSWLSTQLPALERDLERLKGERLPPLLRDNTHCFSLPVLQGDMDMEDLWLQYVSSLQEQVTARLLHRWSRQEILGLALQLEWRDHRLTARLLEELQGMLKSHEGALQDRLTTYGDPKLSSRRGSKVRIATQDHTALKLWEMLDDPPDQKQLFQKYDSLCLRGMWLSEEVTCLQEKLREGVPQLPALERDFEAFYSLMYGDSKRLMLNAKEVSESIEELDAAISQLHQSVLTIQSNLKVKNRSLLDPYAREERNLYTYFFRDPDRLREEVEALEQRVCEFSEVPA
ncbi:HAUS augmin-like complex subunit 3 [Microcaecilia unicolor]|uniref:HAUS augmin-like complex subunit 3 n=1 Tax=Microcaecilia unicolor TaxID=1415580 RepID=A0A6P7WVE0_9AMPH|nr:HAUS augmin-like complex subunit 3 [Microcaecilia unicolor]